MEISANAANKSCRLFSKVSQEETELRKEDVHPKKLFTHIQPEEQGAVETETSAKLPDSLFEEIETKAVREAVKRDMTMITDQCSSSDMRNKEKKTDKKEIELAQSQLPCMEDSPARIPDIVTAIKAGDEAQTQNSSSAGRKRKSWNFDAEISFIFQGGKLCAVGQDGMGCVMGNFDLQIVSEKEQIQENVNEAGDIVGTVSGTFWNVRITLASRKYEGEVRSEMLYEFRWIRDISHERAVLYEGKDIRRLLKIYIQQQIQREQHLKVAEYQSAGWKWLEDGRVCYLTSQGAIGANSISVRAARGFDLLTVPKAAQETLRVFGGMRNIIPGNVKNAVFLQYYTLAAHMTTLFKKVGQQIEFCTALIGKTNTKKTTCAEIFTRVFNRTYSAVPEINFSATEAAMYEIMDKYADAVVMVDDLTPFENDLDAKEKKRKLEILIRSYGDRVPRRRSVSFAGNRTAREFTPIRGCALLTGETFCGGKSSRSRVVILNFEENDVDNSVLSYYQKNLYTLPNFIEKFLQYAVGKADEIMEIIAFECEATRNSVEKLLKIPRYRSAYGVLCATSRIFFDYVVGEGLMDVVSAKALLANDRNLLFQVIAENDSAAFNTAPGIMFIEALKEVVSKGVLPLQEASVLDAENAESCLIRNGEYLCITSEKLWECVRKYTDYRRIYFPYRTGRELIEPLKAENLILTKKEGGKSRSSHKIVLNGKVVNRRFLYLHRDKVEKIWTEMEDV